jgi:tRNA pseudouridine38-40 synthase
VTVLRIEVEYEGTRYRGWQEQKNARSVAGVHALAQVAHVRLRAPVRLAGVRERLAEALPSDIHVLSIAPAGERFHARHDAVARSYVYQISRRRTALAKRFVWWVRRPLELAAMERGAARLVGRHDFAAFCEKPREQVSTLVVVERAEIAPAGDLVLFRIVASHFLWKMVRRVVGTLVELGAGAITLTDLDALLAAGGGAAELRTAEWTAPPSGLFLERVLYAGDPPLGALVAPVPVGAAG